MTDPSFYRRPLPQALVPFASETGRRLFAEALAEGTLEGFFPLAEQFHTQAEPAFCGLGTLVILLNALAIDPGRAWKGPWRWFSEEMLGGCKPLDRVIVEGVTLEEFVCVARCNGARAELRRGRGLGLSTFREMVERASRAKEDHFMALSYSRGALGQTGGGHFSPLGGYHAASDQALVLDVARFKYPPHWVPLETLHAAISTLDDDTGLSRGLALLSRGDLPGAVYCRLSRQQKDWGRVARHLFVTLSAAWREDPPQTLEALVLGFGRALPFSITEVLEVQPDAVGIPSLLAEQGRVGEALRATALYRMMPEVEGAGAAREMSALFLLALPVASLAGVPEALIEAFEEIRRLPADGVLAAEVAEVRRQMMALREWCCGSSP